MATKISTLALFVRRRICSFDQSSTFFERSDADDTLVCCNLIGKTRDTGMNTSTSECFCLHDFSCGHLDKGRSGQEDLSLFLHEDGIVGKSWVVRATRGGRAEDDRAGILALLTASRQVTEYLTASMEYVELLWEENSSLTWSHGQRSRA